MAATGFRVLKHGSSWQLSALTRLRQIKAAAVEEALRAGVDSNEFDHDFREVAQPGAGEGRALAFLVKYNVHHGNNGNLENLVIILYRWRSCCAMGADPRLDALFTSPMSALPHVQYFRDEGVAPGIYVAAGTVL